MRASMGIDSGIRSLRALAGAVLCAGLLVAGADAQAVQQTLRWQHPDPSTVAGFKIYVGSTSGSYNLAVVDVGKPTPDGSGVYTATIDVPDSGSYFIAMKAYNVESVEGAFSNEILRGLGAPGKPTYVP